MLTFLSVLLFGNHSSGCSSFASHYSLLSKFNPNALSKSAIFRSSDTSSFDDLVKFINSQCFVPIGDDSLNDSFASCVLVIDDVHLPVETHTTELPRVGNIHEVIRSLVHLKQFFVPVTSTKHSRLWKSNGKSFLQRNSSHLRLMATANRSNIHCRADAGLSAIPFARLLWIDASNETIQHIFKTTMLFNMLHITNVETKSCLDALTSETMRVMSMMRNNSVMNDQMIVGSEDISTIKFVMSGEDINIEHKKSRVGALRKRLKVEKLSDDGSRYKLFLLIGAEIGAVTTRSIITSVQLGVPPGWDKEATSHSFYFILEKSETVVCESERSKDWVLGVKLLFDSLKTIRERVDEEWKCNSQERLPLGVTFDLRRLGTVMTCLSMKCATTGKTGRDDLWMWWRSALLQSFSTDQVAVDLLQKSIDASLRTHASIAFDVLNDCTSSPQVRKKKWCADSDDDFRKMLMRFPSVSVHHMRLLHTCPSIIRFAENLATSLKCQRVIVECSSVDVTSAAVAATVCESLEMYSAIFSHIHATLQNVLSDGRPSFMSTPADQLLLQSLHECLRNCVRSVCSDRRPAVIIVTAKELKALKNSFSTISQVLDDGDCSELFSAGDLSSLASDAEEGLELVKKFNLSAALLQKLKDERNSHSVEELQEYDHIVPLLGLGREVLSSVSFFLGSNAARGRVFLGKNAMGGNARSDAILHAKLTNDIKLMVLAESESCVDNDRYTVNDVKSWIGGADVVSTHLLSLSSVNFFEELLGVLLDESQSHEFTKMTSDVYEEGFSQFLGSVDILKEALMNCYECVVPYLANIDSCAPYQFLAQFKSLYEMKLHENEKDVKEYKTIIDVTLKQMQLVSMYRQRENALLQQRQIARADLENALKQVVGHSAVVSRHECSLREQEKNVSHLRMKMQETFVFSSDFSTYCKNVSAEFQASDFLSLRDVDLDVNQKLILDAAALILNISLNGCMMLVSTNGQLLLSPSHPSSLNALIDLQDQEELGNNISLLGLQNVNPETMELLSPIIESIPITGQKQKTRIFGLLVDLISRYISEYETIHSKHEQLEFQKAISAESIAATSHLQHLKEHSSILQQVFSTMNCELDDKMKTYQQIENDLSVVQSFVSRISSMAIRLRSWKDAKSQQTISVPENDQEAPVEDVPSSQSSFSWAENVETRCASIRYCASLAAFAFFGGLLDWESRLKFLSCLQGMETFSCSKMNAAMQDANSTDISVYNFVDSVADHATQLMWQQCGMPAHPEMFVSVSLIMASAKTPFVIDRTGVAIEFLRSMSLCNHSASYDNEEQMSPPYSNSNEERVGVLVRSTSQFPAFVKSSPAAAVFTGFGKHPGAGCVIVTLPFTNSDIDKVASACNDGCLLVIRIPAHGSLTPASLCLNAFIPLLLLPKLRQDVQSISLLGRLLVVNMKFSCFVVSEREWSPPKQVYPLFSIVQFTPGNDAMQQLLLRVHVSHNNMGSFTSLCVMQQRLLSSVVKTDFINMRLLDELDSFSAFVENMQVGDYSTANTMLSSDRSSAVFSHSLDKVEEYLEYTTHATVAMLRVQSLLRQANASLAELLPHTLPYGPSLALAATSSAANVSLSNIYQDFFSLLHSAFFVPAFADSSPSKRDKSLKTPGPGTNAAARIFRALFCSIPQNLRLPIAILTLKDWMGGNQGLDLLLHAPMPSSSIPKNFIKIHQTLATAANVPAAAAIIGSSKSIPNPPKKPAKGSTASNVSASVTAPEFDPIQPSHAGPTWMPVEQYATLMKVCSCSQNDMRAKNFSTYHILFSEPPTVCNGNPVSWTAFGSRRNGWE